MINHQAIMRAYPNVITVDDAAGASDVDGNIIEIDAKKVAQAETIMRDEYAAQEQAKSLAKAALLERLGITADEANLLLL